MDTIQLPTAPEQPQVEASKPQKLTLKQRKWLKLYMETGNATRSALAAYDLDEQTQYGTAENIGYENVRKLEIPFEELLDEAGISDIYLTRKLRENLNATKLYGITHKVWADYPSRNKALETALKLKGKLIDRVDATSKGEKLEESPSVIINMHPVAK